RDPGLAWAPSLVAIIPASIAGSLTYLAQGQVDVLASLFLGVGGVVGAYFGTRLLRRLPLGLLRWLFVALLVVVAIRMLLVVPPRGDGHIEITWVTALLLIAVGLF